MKINHLFIAITLIITVNYGSLYGQRNSKLLYHKNWDKVINAPPEDALKWQEFSRYARITAPSEEFEEVTLPLVFHILNYKGEVKITEEQILSQINVLNKAFSGFYTKGRETYYHKDMAMDAKIRFCFGEPSSGISSINTKNIQQAVKVDNISNVSKSSFGLPPADPLKYINIWITDLPDSMSGFAILPGHSKEMDGIYIDPDQFFNAKSYAKVEGKTIVHLMGRYLGLYPLWRNFDCLDDDVKDTPIHNAPNYHCFEYSHVSMCPGNAEEMIGNFMDGGPDECLFMFSKGQVARMQATLGSKGYRFALKNGTKQCDLINEEIVESRGQNYPQIVVFPIPASDYIHININIFDSTSDMNYSIFSIDNKLMQTGKLSNENVKYGSEKINISNIPTGSYILQIKYDNKSISKNIVILK